MLFILYFLLFQGKCQSVPWSRLDEVFVETAEQGNLDWLKCLLKSGANINATSWDGYSAVIKASKEGDIDLIDFLIENGADINARTSHGFTPLLYAAKNGHHSIIELLVINGADIEFKDEAGLTPLMHLARNGYIDIVSNCITQEGNESNYTRQCSLPQVKDIISFLKH
jgi:ankyrin repeat protein